MVDAASVASHLFRVKTSGGERMRQAERGRRELGSRLSVWKEVKWEKDHVPTALPIACVCAGV
ncbi:unnamed protein product [Protopolystoma xenopodis]|uniref:Uncharacterized protein n=1 Tax=Protopolystoma xenopodis TaxID=117903 RepID=A0A448X9C9_9PLAT|nr:unnamed protein product [Protopolystoma xenopodis]